MTRVPRSLAILARVAIVGGMVLAFWWFALAPSMSLGLQVQNLTAQALTVIVFDSQLQTAAVHSLHAQDAVWVGFWAGESKEALGNRLFSLIALDKDGRLQHSEVIPADSLFERERIIIK